MQMWDTAFGWAGWLRAVLEQYNVTIGEANSRFYIFCRAKEDD